MQNMLTSLGATALVAALALVGCKQPVREWSPSDHDRLDEATPQKPSPQPDQVWISSCVACHGQTGKGDGPQGQAMRAPDLTATKATHAQIAATIKDGRGQMPGFDLSPAQIAELVEKVSNLPR